MRKIKFRGFYECEDGVQKIYINGRKYFGQWIYGYYLQQTKENAEGNIIVKHYIQTLTYNCLICLKLEVMPETISQYTGLKDKEDKEIYENDLLLKNENRFFVVYGRGSFRLIREEFIKTWKEEEIKGYYDGCLISFYRNYTNSFKNGSYSFEIAGTIFDQEIGCYQYAKTS